MVVTKIQAPFGIAEKRFGTIGYHPGLDPTGLLRKIGGLAPGHYDPNRPGYCGFKCRPLKIDTWKHKIDTEEYSKNLGYNAPEVLVERARANIDNGPGRIDVPMALFKPKSHNVTRNFCHGKARRFKSAIVSTTPGPGSYGKNHDPYLRSEEMQPPYHHWTYLPPFEWDGFIDRFRIGRLKKPWDLAPNRYDVKEKAGINYTITKTCSKRGPYDCFTGPRDSTTIKGYFAQPLCKTPQSWPRALPGDLDKFFHPSKSRYGCFLKGGRFTSLTRNMLTQLSMCPKDPKEPGPCHYDVYPTKKPKNNKYGFNSSVLYPRPKIQWEIKPCAGRYDQKFNKCNYRKINESFMFKSKCKRGIF